MAGESENRIYLQDIFIAFERRNLSLFFLEILKKIESTEEILLPKYNKVFTAFEAAQFP